jgi:hypothetical protein
MEYFKHPVEKRNAQVNRVPCVAFVSLAIKTVFQCYLRQFSVLLRWAGHSPRLGVKLLSALVKQLRSPAKAGAGRRWGALSDLAPAFAGARGVASRPRRGHVYKKTAFRCDFSVNFDIANAPVDQPRLCWLGVRKRLKNTTRSVSAKPIAA